MSTTTHFHHLVVPPRQNNLSIRIRRDNQLQSKLSTTINLPVRLDLAIRTTITHTSRRDISPGYGRNSNRLPPGLGGRESADGAEHPVSDGAEGVVVEGRHLVRVDGAVG